MEKRYNIQELKAGATAIASAYNIDVLSASKIIGFYNTGTAAGVKYNDGDPEKLAAVLSGDLSSVPAAAAVIGVSLGVNTSGKDLARDDLEKKSPGSAKKIPEKRTTKQKSGPASSPKPKAMQGKTSGAGGGDLSSDKVIKGDIETVPGEVVQDIPGVLPDNVAALVQDAIDSYCDSNGVDDLKKDRQTQWKAACIYVGGSVFRNSKILHDVNRERVQGGKVIDVGRVSALVDLWGFLCLKYNKAPMVDDFARFASVSDSWLYGVECGGNLTPARADILKKLRAMQESGLSGLIVDGRQNPTGALAALNHWHGWTQTREIIHTSGAGSVSAPSLPVFDGSGGFLEDKSGENSPNG